MLPMVVQSRQVIEEEHTETLKQPLVQKSRQAQAMARQGHAVKERIEKLKQQLLQQMGQQI
jgi:hypothetical protein